MSSTRPRERARKIYLGGLLDTVTKEDITLELQQFGDPLDVWIARKPPGFAFVEFGTSAEAEKAVRTLDDSDFCGSRIRAEYARGRIRRGSRGSRSSTYVPSRRSGSPIRRSGKYSPYRDSSRYPYDDFSASMYNPDMAAAAAVAAGFPYGGMQGYAPMMPFMPPEDLFNNFQAAGGRNSSGYSRGRSPNRRRSRSPLGAGSRHRGHSPPTGFDARPPLGLPDRAAYGNSRSRDVRNGYPPPYNMEDRHDLYAGRRRR